MPSFRVTVTVGALRPGAMPERVLPAAADAVAEAATVEARDVSIVAGRPRLVVRFTADDSAMALAVGRRAVEGMRELAEPVAWTVTRRDGGRWYVVR